MVFGRILYIQGKNIKPVKPSRSKIVKFKKVGISFNVTFYITSRIKWPYVK